MAKKTLLFLVFALTFMACTKRYPEISWDYSTERITGVQYEKLDSIHLDVYVDATTSMEGFAATSPSNYSLFLDLLETQSLVAWRQSNIKYHKFGSFVKPISRDEFLNARNNLDFYRDRDRSPETNEMLFMKTYVGKVVERTDIDRLGILITDLIEDDRDLRLGVTQIQQHCFERGIKVGIIPMTSSYDGTVFDTPQYPQGYRLRTDSRPFYAIVFGNPNNMLYLFEALATSDIVDPEKILLYTNNIIKNFDVSVEKTRESRFVNRRAPREKFDNVFEFSMRENGDTARFHLKIDFKKHFGVPLINENAIEMFVNKKSVNDPKGEIIFTPNNNDFRIEDFKMEDGTLHATLFFRNTDPAGNYSYEIVLGLNQLTGLNTPPWVADYSTTNPVRNKPSASLTYNLEEFTTRLLRAQASVERIDIANFYIHIFKR